MALPAALNRSPQRSLGDCMGQILTSVVTAAGRRALARPRKPWLVWTGVRCLAVRWIALWHIEML